MPHFAITLDPDAGYGRGIFLNGAALTEPLDLIYGADNSLSVAFVNADGSPRDFGSDDFTRLLVRIVQPDAVLAETSGGISVSSGSQGYLSLEIADVTVETPEILRQIADRRPGAPDSPDYEEQETYCRATLEIIGFAAWDDEHFARRFGIPVRIRNRDKIALTEIPEPRADFLTAAETMSAIRQTIRTEGGSVFPLARHCFYHALYGTVSYLDDENDLEFVGYQAAGWNRLRLWLVSADADVAGEIVLALGPARTVAAVGKNPAMAELIFANPLTGALTLTRDTADSRDTLKDPEGNLVTALALDWRVC